MGTAFPTAQDVLGDPTSGNRLSDALPKHSAIHSTVNDAIELIEGILVAPAGTVIRNIADTQFAGGAKLDGVTNDAPAVNAAIASVPANKAGVIFHPGGICLCTTNVNITQGNTHFVGVGVGGSIYKFGAAASLIGNFGGSTVYFSFRSLTISGQGTTPAALVQLTNAYVLDFVDFSAQDAAILLQLNSCGHIHITPSCLFNFNQASNQIAVRLSNSVLGQIFGTYEGKTGGTADFIVLSGVCDTIAIQAVGRENHARLVRYLNSANCNNISIVGCNTLNEKVSLVSVDNGGKTTDSIIASNTALGDGTAGIAYDFSQAASGVSVQIIGNRSNNFGGSAPVSMAGATGYLEHWGSGTPEAAIAAPRGSIWHRDDGGAGTSLYVKESMPTPSTGWVGK